MAEINNDQDVLTEYEERQYQIDLYKSAKKQNIIACLGTGTGKTFISILLMSDPQYLAQLNGSYKFGTAKRTIFIVPTRPLVHQQRDTIVSAPQTSVLKVGAITGEMGVSSWKKEEWDDQLEEHQVLVMTSNIFLNMLEHTFLTLDRINLLVVDEVHWASRRKNGKESAHSYKRIMKRFNDFDVNRRPRVLGLSATPINCSMSVEDFSEAVADIEKTYSAVCMTSNVGQFGAKPEEMILDFINTKSYLSESGGVVVRSIESFIESMQVFNVWIKKCEDKQKCPDILIRMKKIFLTIKNILIDPDQTQRVIRDEQSGETSPLVMNWMGIWCASIAVDFYIKEIEELKEVYEEVDKLNSNVLGFAINFLKQIQETFALELNVDPLSPMKTASPKMLLLLDVLKDYKPIGGQESTLCGIIFVNQRCVAKVLCNWLMEMKRIQPELYGFLNVGWVVGHSARPGIETRIAVNSDSVQKKIIEKFHKNEFNLLVATSVLEEGLDVRTCNLVVRFDWINTFREYLQSKGRARAKCARFIMITSKEDKHKLQNKLKNLQQMEEMVKNLTIKEKAEPTTVSDTDDPHLYYKVESTGAKIDCHSAIALLHMYCNKLSSDSFTQLKPIFEIVSHFTDNRQSFQGIVVLPVNCPLERRIIEGPLKNNGNSAKIAVAIKAIEMLHKCGEFDDRLVPVNREAHIEEYVQKLGLSIKALENDQEQRKSPNKQRVGSCGRKERIVKQVAQVFKNSGQNTSDLYLCGIRLEFPKRDSYSSNDRTFGIISGQPIVNSSLFSVYLKTICDEVVDSPESSEVKVELFVINQICLNIQMKERIEKFHRFLVEEIMRFKDLSFDSNNSEFKLLFVPLINERVIDWKFIDKFSSLDAIKTGKLSDIERESYKLDKQSFTDCIFYPWYKDKDQRGRPIVYYAKSVSHLNSRSEWMSNKYKSFDEYFSKALNIEIKNKDLPLIEGRAINKSSKGVFKGAQLKPYSTGRRDRSATEYYPPELVYVHPFPASLWRKALCLPAVVYRLNHLYLAEELRRTIHLGTEPRIGSLTVDCLRITSNSRTEYFESKKNNELKRSSNSLDTNEEYVQNDYKSETDCNSNIPPHKKQCKEASTFSIEENNSELMITDHEQTNSASNNQSSGGIHSFSQLRIDLKATFDEFFELVKSYINDKDDGLIEKLTEDKIRKHLDSCVEPTELPDLRYGEAFPFIFKGDIAQHIRQRYDATVGDPLSLPSADLLLEAITMVGADDSFNLERLEVIGDSFLKLITSEYVYFSCPHLDEGRLTYLRQLQICNFNLYNIGLQKNIDKLLVSHKWFPNNNWLIPSYHISDEKDLQILDQEQSKSGDNKRTDSFKHRIVKNKSVADSIEALIGAHLMKGGTKSALIFMEWLGLKVIPLGAPPVDYLNCKGLPGDHLFRWLPNPKEPISAALDLSETQKSDFIEKHFFGANLEAFEKIIEYEFQNKAYLIQALTHSSYHLNEYTDCYEKPEFLGDAIIDYLISRHIFATPNKKFNPGQLTELRIALVNNSFFAAIAVKYNFHKFLKNLSPDLFRAIHNFVKEFNEEKVDSVIKSFDKLTEEECKDIQEVEVPKALGDIFESVAGAIFLDSRCSLDVVWRVYYKLMKPEIDYFTEHIPQMPVKLIWELFPKGSVQFGESEKIGPKIRVLLKAQGKEYTGFGKNRKLAKIAAAKNALKVIKQ